MSPKKGNRFVAKEEEMKSSSRRENPDESWKAKYIEKPNGSKKVKENSEQAGKSFDHFKSGGRLEKLEKEVDSSSPKKVQSGIRDETDVHGTTKEGSSKDLKREGSLKGLKNQGSSKDLGAEGSSSKNEAEKSAKEERAEEKSAKESSSRGAKRQGSLKSMKTQGSSSGVKDQLGVMEENASTRELTREGSSRGVKRRGSLKGMKREGSSSSVKQQIGGTSNHSADDKEGVRRSLRRHLKDSLPKRSLASSSNALGWTSTGNDTNQEVRQTRQHLANPQDFEMQSYEIKTLVEQQENPRPIVNSVDQDDPLNARENLSGLEIKFRSSSTDQDRGATLTNTESSADSSVYNRPPWNFNLSPQQHVDRKLGAMSDQDTVLTNMESDSGISGPWNFDPSKLERNWKRPELSESQDGYGYVYSQPLYTTTKPWFLSFLLSLFLTIPLLLIFIVTFYAILGRMWTIALFAEHFLLDVLGGLASLAIYAGSSSDSVFSTCYGISLWTLTCLSSLADILMFSFGYPLFVNTLIHEFLTECDGSDVPEYANYKTTLTWTLRVGYVVVALRILLGTFFWISCLIKRFFPNTRRRCRMGFFNCGLETIQKIRHSVLWTNVFLLLVASVYFGWSLYSIFEYFFSFGFSSAQVPGSYCDPLDTTECMLPFPSYHFMIPSNVSATGYRVNLIPEVFPPLKGRGGRIHADFLNNLDGFPTMGPIMFYIEGLKQAHQALLDQPTLASASTTMLMWPSDTSMSTSQKSMTLLLDVEAAELVHHSAEVDYLDPKNPLVLVFPAQPLKHGTHYALAVINATNATGTRLPPTAGMTALLSGYGTGTGNATGSGKETGSGYIDEPRRHRFLNQVIPALEKAAPWFSYSSDPKSLQLLFDFPTVSEESQLGPIRAVRDGTMDYISANDWSWDEHARVDSIEDNNCLEEGTHYARTINAELDVPWFLQGFGPGHRAAFLDDYAVDSGNSSLLGKAKFRIHVPCSVWAATVTGESHGTLNSSLKPVEVKAVLEYGHSLFSTRNEASSSSIQRLADEEGYIVIAMDSRGMSRYDLLVVFKALVAQPRMFQAVRDNLIQGYACKLAMQHFTRYAMLSKDWLSFETRGQKFQPQVKNASHVYYGNSQGGILGAGYVALSGPTKLIDRAILGVPGSPFALIMTRSIAFEGYDDLLLLNFHNNRHVRMLLGLVQMAWDSTEGSGFLAQPVNEPYPPVLIQAGLGDTTVPTHAAEALARGFGAKLLPHHPREIFGLNDSVVDNTTLSLNEAVFTEILFTREFKSLPKNDVFGTDNAIHVCLREDEAVNRQIATFINEGTILDVCAVDNCVRKRMDDCSEYFHRG